MIRSKGLVFLLSLAAALSCSVAAEHIVDGTANQEASLNNVETSIVLPNYDGREGPNRYVERLITSALATLGQSAVIAYHPLPSNVKRIEKLLSDEGAIDVAWLPATRQRIERLSYVPVPIYQGLHGTRLLLVNQTKLSEFAKVDTIEGLKALIGVQHRTWSDTEVLKSNGLPINGELEYDNMLRAIESGLADYFPRSAMTIQSEQRRLASRGIVIEPRLSLVYPNYFLLFVSTRSPALLADLSRGVDNMASNGELQVLFKNFFDARFEGLNLHNRTRIVLSNPELPDSLVEELKNGIVYN